MKITAIILLFTCLVFRLNAQSIEEASKLYRQHNYTGALKMANALLKNDSKTADVQVLIGRIYDDQERYKEAIPYLQKAIALDNDRTYVSGWSYACLGHAYMMTDKKELAIKMLHTAISHAKTKNSVSYAQHYLDVISLEPKWVVIEKKHIIYHFQDTVRRTKQVQDYMQVHEQAYEKINKTFKAVLPTKMVFYVWNDRQLAKKVLNNDLGFTLSEKCLTEICIDQSVGHEMTHTLAYWAWGIKPVYTTRFINEGVAVAFDQNPGDKYVVAQKAVVGKNYHSVLEIWNGNNVDEDIIYPVGGAFVSMLYEKSTPAQFRQIIKKQSPEDAAKIYGKDAFTRMVNEFNNKIGLR